MADTTFRQMVNIVQHKNCQLEFNQKWLELMAPPPSIILSEHIETETKQISRVCCTLAAMLVVSAAWLFHALKHAV